MTSAERQTVDVLVVGGGPAGSAAAVEACRAGLRVKLIDKASFPRDKCCGDGLTTGALRQLDELGLDPVTVPSWRSITDVYVRSPRGRATVFPLPAAGRGGDRQGLFAAVARRAELDVAVLDLARAAGAEVGEGHELRALDPRPDAVVADVDGPDGRAVIEARYVIGADGMWSTTRKLLGVDTGGYRGDWHAFRQYYAGVTGRAGRELMVWFEPDLLPGYVWAFPVDQHSANVGFGVVRRDGAGVQFMRRRWLDILDRPHIRAALGPNATPEAPHRAWPIPARLGRFPAAIGRTLFVGDACAATDPMTGEGIGQALETGRMAVAALAAAGVERPDEAGRVYRRELDRGMARDHRLAASLSGVLRRPWGVEASLRAAGATAWTRRNFARWLFEDYPRAALFTPHRWRRRLLSGSGAFEP